ncbi:glycoside hydrolase family 76 protein [Patellaria atrata CBS 101060]|uniref:Mannan endo-1,6-alpha-mannosidase n=1 Tax=Patellaria atrata CBS 101060 TaxID=1346257 RepID=A0A9P4VQD9_9PEZI|nr:glycoside hydrolase family 76 protein [Patellaria atrata CBS 101060]
MWGLKHLVLISTTCIVALTRAVELDVNSDVSIRDASATYAYGVLTYYTGNLTGTPVELIGMFPQPYYWWEAGATWGALVDYWAYTGDPSYINTTIQALIAQLGPENNYMPPARNAELGNDDQAFWALAAMTAAEYSFPASPPDVGSTYPSYLDIVRNVFDGMITRWDLSSCAGGLKWQIFEANAGYHYKSAIANGGLFQISARLARYTGNATYVEWAERVWGWCERIGLIGRGGEIFDGSDDLLNCTELNHLQWSYNAGAFLYGAANLYNYTNGSSVWQTRLSGLLTATGVFFTPEENATDVLFEQACETRGECNTDQLAFKAFLARWMAKSAVLAPYTAPAIMTLLTTSALGAAAACSGPLPPAANDPATANSTVASSACGSRWYTRSYDGVTGLGQQLAALEVTQALLLLRRAGPVPITLPNVVIATDVVPTTTLGVPHRTATGEASGPTNAAMGRFALGEEEGVLGCRILWTRAFDDLLDDEACFQGIWVAG